MRAYKEDDIFSDRVEAQKTADTMYTEMSLPMYKLHSKYIANETNLPTKHRCAAYCNLMEVGGEACSFFKFDNVTNLCMMGSFEKNDTTSIVIAGYDTVYLKIGMFHTSLYSTYHLDKIRCIYR